MVFYVDRSQLVFLGLQNGLFLNHSLYGPGGAPVTLGFPELTFYLIFALPEPAAQSLAS